MGEAGNTGLKRGDRRVIGRIGVAGSQDDPRLGQFMDVLGCAVLRGEGDQGLATFQTFQQGLGLGVERAEHVRIVDALAVLADERALNMDSQSARNTCRKGGFGGAHGGIDDVELVADQCGQKSRCAIGAVCLANGGDAFDRRGIVEQDATAAIDLGVDKARQQIATIEIEDAATQGKATAYANNGFAVTAQAAGNDTGWCDDLGVGEAQQGHTVFVTLFRCGGESGLRPRARERLLARR